MGHCLSPFFSLAHLPFPLTFDPLHNPYQTVQVWWIHLFPYSFIICSHWLGTCFCLDAGSILWYNELLLSLVYTIWSFTFFSTQFLHTKVQSLGFVTFLFLNVLGVCPPPRRRHICSPPSCFDLCRVNRQTPFFVCASLLHPAAAKVKEKKDSGIQQSSNQRAFFFSLM